MGNILFGERIERTTYSLFERFLMFGELNEVDRLRMVLVLGAVIVFGIALAVLWFKFLYAPQKVTKAKLKRTYYMQAIYWVFALFFTLNTFLPKDYYDTILEDNQPQYEMYEVDKDRYVKDDDTLYKVSGWKLVEETYGVLIPTEK